MKKNVLHGEKSREERLENALQQAVDFLSGEDNGTRVDVVTVEVDEVTGIRRNAGISQADFADRLGISVATLRNWEQGRRKPTGPARKLLQLLKKHPETVLELEPGE